MVLAGPVDLLQGGQGFIGRFPVFVDDADGEDHLWGLVSAVVDVERLYEDSGFLDPDLPIDIAIAGRDAQASDNTVFFGRPEIFDEDPVLSRVTLPAGSWRLAAIPRGGWEAAPSNAWQFRFFLLLAGLLIILPISIAGIFTTSAVRIFANSAGARTRCRNCRTG
jgi:sensor domain CHASE-containing protein